MDNFHFDMTSKGEMQLKKAMMLFPYDKVIGYREDEEKGLIFYWSDSPRTIKLPFPMNLDQAADFAAGWLEHASYGKEPDHDGDNGKGWRLYTEDWGHVDGEYQAFMAVKPVWAMYGK